MLNALIQLSTLAYGLVVNFLAPTLYGIEAYGAFVAANAVVSLVHRAMTIISEPLIRFTEPHRLLASSLALNSVVLLAFMVANHFVALGSSMFLSGLLLSSSCLLAMQALRLRRSYIVFLVAMTGFFAALMIWSSLNGFVITLVQAMEISAWVPSFICTIYLFSCGSTIPARHELKETIRHVVQQMPRLVTITGVMNLLTSALPVFLAPVLSARDMGLFKVMSSVLQAAIYVFPVSTQTVLANFVNHPRGVEFYRLLSSFAMLYFAAVCIGLVGLAMLVPSLVPYVALASCLPVYYQAILLERHLTAGNHIRTLVIINLSVIAVIGVALMFEQTLLQALLIYAGGFTLYAVALSMADKDFRPYPPLLVLLALCPVVVCLMTQHLAYGIAYGVLVAIAAVLRHVPTRADVMVLWREM